MSPENMPDYKTLPDRFDQPRENRAKILPDRPDDTKDNPQLLPDRTPRDLSIDTSVERKAERILAELRDYILETTGNIISLRETIVVSTCMTRLEQLAQKSDPKSFERFINGIARFKNKEGNTFEINYYQDGKTRLFLKQIIESDRNATKTEKSEDPRKKNVNTKKERIEAKITSVSEAREEIQKRFIVISSIVRSGQNINSDQIQSLLKPSVDAVWHIYQNFAWHQDIIDLFYKTRFTSDKGEAYRLMNIGQDCKLIKW